MSSSLSVIYFCNFFYLHFIAMKYFNLCIFFLLFAIVANIRKMRPHHFRRCLTQRFTVCNHYMCRAITIAIRLLITILMETFNRRTLKRQVILVSLRSACRNQYVFNILPFICENFV